MTGSLFVWEHKSRLRKLLMNLNDSIFTLGGCWMFFGGTPLCFQSVLLLFLFRPRFLLGLWDRLLHSIPTEHRCPQVTSTAGFNNHCIHPFNGEVHHQRCWWSSLRGATSVASASTSSSDSSSGKKKVEDTGTEK